MCGRYKLTAEEIELRKKYGHIWDDHFFDIHGYKKRPEVFPGEWIPAIDRTHRLSDIWWTIEDKDARGEWRRAINGKAETIAKVGMFKDAFRNDRVLIPATALYEWQDVPGQKKKTRYEIWFDEPIFAFAGVARPCEIKGEMLRCGAILTTHPNETFKFIHTSKQRQAVVVREEDYDAWLDPDTSFDELRRIMEPLPDSETHFKVADDREESPLFS